jgi:hypothetical protein
MYESYTLEQLRLVIDEAIDAWLIKAGLTREELAELDYSFIDEELNDLVFQARRVLQ